MRRRPYVTAMALLVLTTCLVDGAVAQTRVRFLSLGGGAGAATSTSGVRLSAGQAIVGRVVSSVSGAEFGFWNLLRNLVVVATPASAPAVFDGLEKSYPNPFNPRTTIRFSLAAEGRVRLELFDLTGRRVDRVYDDVLPAGRHSVVYAPERLSSGVYMLRMWTDGFAASERLVLLR